MTTRALARFAAGTRVADVPPSVLRAARLSVLDWLGSCIAGAPSVPARILEETARELGGTPEATVIGSGLRTSAPLAALANAAASHVCEMDDLDRASIYHPAAPVVSAALAVAERQHAPGPELLRAVVLGYEVSIRIGEALGPSHYTYWHTTGTAGTFGAAVAAGVLLGLDEAAMLHALGSAGTQAAGIWEFLADGAMSKQLHPAKAAMNGILAALIAARGFTGATRVLEGEKGYLRATSAAFDESRLTEGLGPGMARWRITGVSFKPHASCRHTHPAVDAALALRREHGLRPEEVAEVHVRLYRQGYELLAGVTADTPYAAKFNLPYCVACALLYGDVGLDRFSEERLHDPELRALMARVRAEPDPALDALYPAQWPSVVTVRTRDGRTLERRVDHPKGDPENPLTEDEVVAKFHAMAAPVTGEARAARYAEAVLGLERLADVTALTAAAAPAP
ncbi:MAG TPA: MmgE/PrpD family protein [Dehalococcoidia bacterium]